MKSYQSRTIKTTSTRTNTSSNYQPRPQIQPYKPLNPPKLLNTRINTHISYLPKTISTSSKYNYAQKTHYQPRNVNLPGKINYTSNVSNRSSYQTVNTSSYQPRNRSSYQPFNSSTNYQTSKWKNNRGGRVGDTETKVEVKQDGDYILKITTTKKVIDKGAYGYNGY